MRAEQFDDYVIALVRGLRASGVEFLLLEDDDIDSVTVVPGPTRRNLDRLVRALKRMDTTGRVPGERETLPVDYDHLLKCGPSRWPMRVDGADTDIMVVDVADGRFGRYYEESRRVEIEPGVAVDVVPDAPIMKARRADATDVMPELSTMSQRERDRERMKQRQAAAKAERRARRSGGAIAPVPVLSGPRTFANLRRPH